MGQLFRQKEFKIIHIDMDCFYAQVEMRDNPSLVGQPIGIGGPSRTKGILCTSNYEARAFGVKSAQPTFQAFQLCPDLILIPPDFSKYEEASKIINKIYRSFSDSVQPVSLDEAYIDVTHSKLFNGSASLIAQEIKNQIFQQTGLTASAGVSFNKMLAKIGSDWNKPNGLFVVTPSMREDFMENLPLSKIPGIGKVSYGKYKRLGLHTCGDITKRNLFDLIRLIGKRSALEIYRASQGISNSTVKNRTQRKSFGIERTFFNSVIDNAEIDQKIEELLNHYNIRFSKLDQFHLNNRDISHLSIKIRFSDFKTYTREIPINKISSDKLLDLHSLDEDSAQKIKALFQSMRQTYKQPIRLIGLGIKLRERKQEQLDFGWSA